MSGGDARKKPTKRDRSKKRKKNVIHVDMDIMGSTNSLMKPIAALGSKLMRGTKEKKKEEAEEEEADLSEAEVAWRDEVKKAKLVMARKRARSAKKSQHRKKMK
jgi:hypothetical protein